MSSSNFRVLNEKNFVPIESNYKEDSQTARMINGVKSLVDAYVTTGSATK